MEFETNQCLMMNASEIHTWSSKMPQGLDLEITQQHPSMRGVAHLIIALERLQHHESPMSSEFRDEDLLNFMLESVLEEQLVFPRESAPPRDAQFVKRREIECSVTDREKRTWVLRDTELQAVMLQEGNIQRKVHLNLSTYRHPATSPEEGARPVTLNIKETNLFLCCSKTTGGSPTLTIEDVPAWKKEELQKIARDSEEERFLFYRRDTGLDVTTLMSASNKDWYISTAQRTNAEAVQMCQQGAADRYTTFTIHS